MRRPLSFFPGSPLASSELSAKVTRLWTALHEFERMSLVVELLLRDQGYANLETTTVRNWWRPVDDKYYGQLWASDPVFIVTGTLKG
ncbi:MAG: hypothetical protein ACOC0T_04745 [Desulfovermiculus sp.]